MVKKAFWFFGVLLLAVMAWSPAVVADPHSTETQQLLDRIEGASGWLLGLGELKAGQPWKKGVHRQRCPRDLRRWRELYGNHLPVIYEFELGEAFYANHDRDWASARWFADKGGIPWFRLHLKNFSTEKALENPGSPWDKTGGLATVLAGGEGHFAFVHALRELAQEFKAYGRPCVFRPFHEMNGDWFWWGNDPKQFISLWQLARRTFREEQVTNVLWCWSPNVDIKNEYLPAMDYYPGDEAVDLVGLDAYFAADDFPQQGIDQMIQIATETGKPILLGELGPAAREGFWQDVEVDFKQIPQLKGFILWWARGYHHWSEDPSQGSLIDANSSAEVRANFQRFLESAHSITLDEWR